MTEQIKKVLVPDIGGAEDVDVIEVLVSKGDQVAVEDPLVTLESDKASMEIPAPFAGVVESIALKVGDQVSEGSLVLSLKTAESKTSVQSSQSTVSEADPKANTSKSIQEVTVPDIGDAENVDVIEVAINAGDVLQAEDTLMTLEGDKATMDVPAPFAGKVTDVKVKVGDKVSAGSLVCLMETSSVAADSPLPKSQDNKVQTPAPKSVAAQTPVMNDIPSAGSDVHAGPAVRRIAREFGVDLRKVKGTGEKNRIIKLDLQNYVKQALRQAESGGNGFNFPAAPKIDFTKFGKIETQPLSKIKKLSGTNLHRNWVTIPHVTQFDEADITDMEAFRQEQKQAAAEKGFKLTPLIFLMKAVVATLKEYPEFNASLDSSGENLIIKKYHNIGVAVDTPNGLVVPVVRDVECKGMFDLAKELGDISQKARTVGLGMKDMQGGCFTISSLGGIGGTAFTPIINAPEVAILGVSRSAYKPVYRDGEFVPRLMLPLSLSYDHRVIDGAAAARFIVTLSAHLADIRTLL